MSVYALWNNKGGVGKSYLTFQLSCEYAARVYPQKVLVIDLCPQANSSGMLLGGMIDGELRLDELSNRSPRKTISGYIEDRIKSPYVDPHSGSNYLISPNAYNDHIPDNLYLIIGDEQLEIQGSRVSGATNPGPTDAWRIVHTWISDLINDIKKHLDYSELTVFIDCNPSFSIYTELAMSASDRLIIPFSADGSSKRAVKAVLSLIYGITRYPGSQRSEYFLNSDRFKMQVPKIYCYIGNRLTQYIRSATAFKTVVSEIGEEIWSVWQSNKNLFYIHPSGTSMPNNRTFFKKMFQFEVVDANTASVVSSALGIPINKLTAGPKTFAGKKKPAIVNQSQLDKQQPNIKELIAMIE